MPLKCMAPGIGSTWDRQPLKCLSLKCMAPGIGRNPEAANGMIIFSAALTLDLETSENPRRCRTHQASSQRGTQYGRAERPRTTNLQKVPVERGQQGEPHSQGLHPGLTDAALWAPEGGLRPYPTHYAPLTLQHIEPHSQGLHPGHLSLENGLELIDSTRWRAKNRLTSASASVGSRAGTEKNFTRIDSHDLRTMPRNQDFSPRPSAPPSPLGSAQEESSAGSARTGSCGPRDKRKPTSKWR